METQVIGIELGSTRIKAVLIDKTNVPVASGSHEWENRLVNGIWTYAMDDVREGVRAAYADLVKNLGEPIGTVAAIGVSGMMHGYLPFGKDGKQLAEFRTWRNTITSDAAEKLTALFGFNIPQRWSVAHLYQAVLNGEEHVRDIARLTTLAGQIHFELTGRHVLGVGEASGMFPIDSGVCDYDGAMLEKFKATCGIDLRAILPKVLKAGETAGYLTESGARFLDPTGNLKAGIPVAPPEGDAGTGMAATNSVRAGAGNVSAGTSDFAMIVTEKSLGVHREIDMVTTPDGKPVAMVHCNNCTSDINAWADLLCGFSGAIGKPLSRGKVLDLIFAEALKGDTDCGGLISYNYFSGEGVTDLDEGRPIFARMPDSVFSFANFAKTHVLSALATLKIGLDILAKEDVVIDRLCAHGGFFKSPVTGQKMLSAAANAPVTVMETAGEGGPYGMALLAKYMVSNGGRSLPDWLDEEVFANAKSSTVTAEPEDIAGFNAFLARYKKALPMEKCAVEVL